MYIRAKRSTVWSARAFAFLLSLEIIMYIFNGDKYFQLSGFYLPLIGALIIGILNFGPKMRFQKYQLMCMMLVLIYIICTLINIDNFDKGYFLSYLVGICLLIELACIDFPLYVLDKLEKSYVLSAIIISLVILIFQKRYYALEANRLTIQIGNGPLVDPNYLAFFLICPVVICVDKMILRGMKSVYSIAALVIGIGVFMTGSRGAFVSVLIGVVYMLLTHQKFKRNKTKYILICLVCVVIGIVLLPQETLQRLFKIGTWMGDGANVRRFELWSNALRVIIERPLIGYGASDTSLIIGRSLGIYEPAHSTFLDICLQCGVLFSVILLWVCCNILMEKENKLSKGICLVTLIASIFVSTEATLALWLNIGMSIGLINEGKNNE